MGSDRPHHAKRQDRQDGEQRIPAPLASACPEARTGSRTTFPGPEGRDDTQHRVGYSVSRSMFSKSGSSGGRSCRAVSQRISGSPHRSTRGRPRCECPTSCPRALPGGVARHPPECGGSLRRAQSGSEPPRRPSCRPLGTHSKSFRECTVDPRDGVDDVLKPRLPVPSGHGWPHAGWLRGSRGVGRWP